jgi:hypothetical protein
LQEKEQGVAAVMRFMLFRQQQKPDMPVKREELAKVTQAVAKRAGNLTSYAIAHAKARFATAFGMELKCVELMPGSRPGKAGKGETVYQQPRRQVLILTLPELTHDAQAILDRVPS